MLGFMACDKVVTFLVFLGFPVSAPLPQILFRVAVFRVSGGKAPLLLR